MKKILSSVVITVILTVLCGMVTLAAPTKVGGVKQTNASSASVTLQWNAVTGALNYEIYDYSTGRLGNKIKSVKTTSAAVSGLKEDNLYSYAVVAQTAGAGSTDIAGNYTVVTAKTTPGIVTGIEAKYASRSSAQVYWNQKNNADGYEVTLYTYKNKKQGNTITVTKNNKAKVKQFKANQFYKIKVQAYVTVNRQRKYGEAGVLQTTNDIKLKKKEQSKGVQLSWSKVKGATSYTVYGRKGYAKETAKYTKVATTKKTSVTVKKVAKAKLKKKNTYYFYVVANRKDAKTGTKYKSMVQWAYDVVYKVR